MAADMQTCSEVFYCCLCMLLGVSPESFHTNMGLVGGGVCGAHA